MKEKSQIVRVRNIDEKEVDFNFNDEKYKVMLTIKFTNFSYKTLWFKLCKCNCFKNIFCSKRKCKCIYCTKILKTYIYNYVTLYIQKDNVITSYNLITNISKLTLYLYAGMYKIWFISNGLVSKNYHMQLTSTNKEIFLESEL